MANQSNMEPEVNEIPTQRAWTPFVGAALALLTTGSLVVFALVAQRTSLDGFSNERVTAARPAGVAPPAITIAPAGASAPADDGSSTGGGTAIGVASPDVPVAALDFFDIETSTFPLSRDRDIVALAPRSDDADGDTQTEGSVNGRTLPLAALDNPNLRHAELFALGRGGRSDEGDLGGWDARHDGKHSHRSHDAKGKAKKSKKAKGHRSQAGGSPAEQRASSGYTSSGASRPARPAPQSSNAGRSSAPAHSNAGGNGKAHGRGHKKH